MLRREQKQYDVLTALPDSLYCHEPRRNYDLSQDVVHHKFNFDYVFGEDANEQDIFQQVLETPLTTTLESALCGERADLTIFAYGQTGSGKTHTMYPLYRTISAQILLSCHSGVQLSFSLFELYCAKVYDLLAQRAQLRTLEDATGEVQVAGLQEILVESIEEAEQIIEIGERARITSANAVHNDSSRSHAVLQLVLRDGTSREQLAKISLVDLAGSERAADCQSDDKATRYEGAEINKSLLALKECIRALGRRDKHKQFRGSKLTQILRSCLVGKRSRAVMIATLSPGSGSTEHTLK